MKLLSFLTLFYLLFPQLILSINWLHKMSLLHRNLLISDIQISMQLALEFASLAASYWTPYKCSFDNVGCTSSLYINYHGDIFMTEKNNTELSQYPGTWKIRAAIYQTQLLFFRTIRDTCPEIGAAILQLPNFNVDRFHQTVTCFNPLHIVSAKIYELIGQARNCTQNPDKTEVDRAIRVVSNAINFLTNHTDYQPGPKLLHYHSITTLGKYNLHFNIMTPDWRGHYIQYFDLINHFLKAGITVSITSTEKFFIDNQDQFPWCTSGQKDDCVLKWSIGYANNTSLKLYNEPFVFQSSRYEKDRPHLIIFDHLLYAGKVLCAKYQIPGVSVATNPISILDPNLSSNNLFSLKMNTFYNQSTRESFIREYNENLEYFADLIGTNSFSPTNTWLEWRCFPPTLANDGSSINTLATSPLRNYRPTSKDQISEPILTFLSRVPFGTPIAFVSGGSWSKFVDYPLIISSLTQRNFSVILSSVGNIRIHNSNVFVSTPSQINQLALLNHAPITLFFSHCGYNSLMESIEALVPIICSPLHSDQPGNSKRVEDAEIGIYIRKNDEIPSALDTFTANYMKYRNNMIKLRTYIRETTIPLTEVTKLLVKVANYGVKLVSHPIQSDWSQNSSKEYLIDSKP